jgi:hypothetical protein
MPEYNFQLRGWQAIAAIVALLGFFGIKAALHVRPINDEMRAVVRERLLNEYSGRGPRDLARMVQEAREGLPVETPPPVIQRDVEFNSIVAHGKIGAGVTIRAQVTVDGGAPPDGRSIRYFALSRKFEGGWMVMGESNPYSYYYQLFP